MIDINFRTKYVDQVKINNKKLKLDEMINILSNNKNVSCFFIRRM